MIGKLPDLADGVLKRIPPPLETVREIVRAQEPVDRTDRGRLARATQPVLLVQAVREFDTLATRGHAPGTALVLLRQRGHLAADLRSSKGTLLVSRGHMLTDEVLVRVRNYAALTGLEGRPVIERSTVDVPPSAS